MSQKIVIESLAMDLLRAALGLHRGSLTMAERFKQEAIKRRNELNEKELPDYIYKFLPKLDASLNSQEDRTAEDLLMYSIIFQNYARSKLSN